MKSIAIEVKDLNYKINDQCILDQVYLDVRKGERFGVLGPKKSGKSTLFHLMTCCDQKSSVQTSGHISILGMNFEENEIELKKRIGVVSQYHTDLEPGLTLYQTLFLHSKYYEIPFEKFKEKSTNLMDKLDLLPLCDEKVGLFSKVLRKKVSFLKAILHSPEVLMLDDPTMDLSYEEQKEIIDFLISEKSPHQTWLIFSSDFENINNWCDRITFIDKGHTHYGGTLDQFPYTQKLPLGEYGECLDEKQPRWTSEWACEIVEFRQNIENLDYYKQRLREKDYIFFEHNDKCYVFVLRGQDLHFIMDLLKGLDMQIRKPNLWDSFMKNMGYIFKE